MPSHSRKNTQQSHQKTIEMQDQRENGTLETFAYQQVPQAPGELNVIFGYGTSSSFPLFWAGIIASVKRFLDHLGPKREKVK